MKHKHYDKIEEWAGTGKLVQHFIGNNAWCLCTKNKPEWNENTIYRFKPEVIKYKLYSVKNHSDSRRTICCHQQGHSYSELDRETAFDFIEWIDKEWQEYEL